MDSARVAVVAVLGFWMAACAGGSQRPPLLMEGRGTEDVVRLTNGEVVKGRILEENARTVVVERDDRVLTLPRAAVYSIDYSRDSWKERNAPLRESEAAPSSPRPASSWYARRHPSEQVEQTEVLWFDGHPFEDCVGESLGKAHAELPDFKLFVEPGGRVLLQDPRRWGYHAHGFPGGFYKPGTQPGLSIELSRNEAELPSALAFVSPSQEMKSQDGGRGSYTPPDAVYAELRALSTAEGMLAVQPFAGGRAAETRLGSLWAFTLPRNSKQFYLYLLDPAKKHGETLKAAYAGYGDTILAPDLMIDSVAADGTAVGRVMVLPYPDGIPADGPAPEALTVYSGPTHDPSRVAAAAIAPRLSLQLPTSGSATKATLLLCHFDVLPNVPQSMLTAWGTGRPAAGEANLAMKDLKPKEPDHLVRIDLSGWSEDRFPAVAWFQHRRTYAWKSTGGMLGTSQPPPPFPDPSRLTKVKRSEAIPHVLPLLFTGPKGAGPASTGAPQPAVSGGMSTSLIGDAFAREAGGALTSSLAPNPGATSGAGQGMSSVTNVYISSPTHSPLGGEGSGLSSRTGPGGVFMSQTPGWNNGPTPNPWGLGAFGAPTGTQQGSVYRDHRGQVIYDAATGNTAPQQSSETQSIDPVSGRPIFNFRRTNR